jgi:hypothetical protein
LVPNVAVTFSTEVGNLASGGAAVFTDSAGQARDTLTVLREQLSGLAEPFFTVTARATGEGGAPIEESVEIDVLGGPVSMFLQATPTSVNAETGGEVQLLAGVFDGAGDPLEGANVNFLTELGALASGGGSLQTGPGGTVTDILVVTPADLAGFPSSSFVVRAQARGLGGLVLEETVSIRIQTGFPHAEFNFTGAPGNVVTFTNLSTGQQPLSCSWDFGAGANPGTSSSCASPIVVTYTTPGNKTVSLVVSNVLGSDTAVANFEVLP